MKITTELTPEAYKISKKVYEGKLTHSEGVKLLAGDNRMNKNSAADYVYNFRCMIEGRRFTRTTAKEVLESKYRNYCQMLGITPNQEGGGHFKRKRKYWALTLTKESAVNNELTGEFPEGNISQE